MINKYYNNLVLKSAKSLVDKKVINIISLWLYYVMFHSRLKKERYSALYFCYIKLEKWKKEEENEKTVKTEIDGEDKEEEKRFFFFVN